MKSLAHGEICFVARCTGRRQLLNSGLKAIRDRLRVALDVRLAQDFLDAIWSVGGQILRSAPIWPLRLRPYGDTPGFHVRTMRPLRRSSLATVPCGIDPDANAEAAAETAAGKLQLH
jgi:hypothetical protein